MLQYTDFRSTGLISNIRCPESVRAESILERTEIFTHYPPHFLLDLSGNDYKVPAIWGKTRDRHGSVLRQVSKGVLFGSSHIVETDGRCACDTLAYRDIALDIVMSKAFAHFYKGMRPALSPVGPDVQVDVSALVNGNPLRIAEPVFVATPGEPDNYGRWLAQVLPRLSYYREMMSDRKLLIRAKYDWQKKLLGSFGIAEEQILNHDPGATYLCDDIASVQHTVGDLTSSKRDITVFNHVAIEARRRAIAATPPLVFASRLSLSRKNPDYRVLRNEEELIAGLAGLGFVAIEPEQLSFESQVATFANARFVVGLGGAGMFNSMFCSESCPIIDIEANDHFIVSHSGLLSSRGLKYSLIYGKSDVERVHASWTIDVRSVIQAVAALL